MTDLELFKAIVRATQGVASSDVSKAVATVRALLAQAQPEERVEKKGRNRMYLGGMDRGDDAA